MELPTARLVLRSWRPGDIAPFAAMNADPAVMAFFERPMTEQETEAAVQRYAAGEAEDGFCMWALTRADGAFIGVAGIQRVPFVASFTPAVEVGWRLARAHWGCGYATEAAQAAVAYGFDHRGFGHRGFDHRGLAEILAIAATGNMRSLAVMERIGMQRDRDADFDHPRMPQDHPHRLHCVHRLQAPARI